MANPDPVRRVENLRPNRGQGVPNAGAKPRDFKRRREEVLYEIATMVPSECPDYPTVDQMAREKLAALINEGDVATVRWYFDQQIGSPRTTISHEISNVEVLQAGGRVISKYVPLELQEQVARELTAELLGREV